MGVCLTEPRRGRGHCKREREREREGGRERERERGVRELCKKGAEVLRSCDLSPRPTDCQSALPGAHLEHRLQRASEAKKSPRVEGEKRRERRWARLRELLWILWPRGATQPAVKKRLHLKLKTCDWTRWIQNGGHTAVLHWRALCWCTHAKAAS